MIRIPVEAQMTEYLHRKASRAKIPLSGTFELTPLCNMNCRMCYVRLSKQEQEAMGPLHPAEDWIKTAEEAKKAGLLYLLLTGGEPLMHPEFRKIWEALHHMGFILTLNSNGTMIDLETVEWLKNYPPVRVNLTLYGASDETYARLCRNPAGYTQAINAVSLLREAGISVRINCSVTPYNKDDIEQIIRYCKENQLVIAPTSYMFPPLRKDAAMIGRNDRFNPEDAANMQARMEYLTAGEELFLERVKEKNLSGLAADTEENCLETEGEGLRCRAGKCSFWVTWQGDMSACGMFRPEGKVNVFRDSFSDCWNTIVNETAKIRLPAKCAGCSLKDVCRPCAAMVYTESGNFHTVPEYRCRMAHAYPAACLEISREILNGRKTNELERNE